MSAFAILPAPSRSAASFQNEFLASPVSIIVWPRPIVACLDCFVAPAAGDGDSTLFCRSDPGWKLIGPFADCARHAAARANCAASSETKKTNRFMRSRLSSKTISLRLDAHLPRQPDLVRAKVRERLLQIRGAARQPLRHDPPGLHALLHRLVFFRDESIRLAQPFRQRLQFRALYSRKRSYQSPIVMLHIINRIAQLQGFGTVSYTH